MLEMLRSIQTAHFTALSGTDTEIDIEGRDFTINVLITVGKIGNIPAGEIFCAPVETGAGGLIAIDGVNGNVGTVTQPLVMAVEEGRLSKGKSDGTDLKKKIREFCSVDGMDSIIGEFSIGMNPTASLTGNLLEDEKAYRTIHIAFGHNEEMPGGRNTSQVHRNYLFHTPTVTITYLDGSQRELLKDGAMQL